MDINLQFFAAGVFCMTLLFLLIVKRVLTKLAQKSLKKDCLFSLPSGVHRGFERGFKKYVTH